MKNIMRNLCALLLAALFMLGCLPALAAETAADTYKNDAEKLEHIIELYLEHSLADKSREELLYDTLVRMLEYEPELFEFIADALLSSNDPYGYYLTPEQWEELNTFKQYIGVGIVIELKAAGAFVITTVLPGGPAETAGMLPDDQIVYIGGADVRGKPLADVRDLLRGEEGTTVTVGVLRGGADLLYFEIERRQLMQLTVTYELHEDYAYVKVVDFLGYKTLFEFWETIDYLYLLEYDSIIIDLRGNGGGDVDIALNMVNYLVPFEAELITEVGRPSGGERTTFESSGDGIEFERIAVLVNENTASAAEMFAIILQELELAQIIGTKTYGKGVAQLLFPLFDGSYAAVTSFEFLSPDGNSYEGVGVRPDLVVENVFEPRVMSQLNVFSHANYTQVVMSAQNDVVMALEARLVLLGSLSEADDVFDEHTEAALRYYQVSMGLEVTGELDLLTFQSITDAINLLKQTNVEVDLQREAAENYMLTGELGEQAA